MSGTAASGSGGLPGTSIHVMRGSRRNHRSCRRANWRVLVTARETATSAADDTVRLGRLPDSGEFPLGEPDLRLPPGQAQATPDGTALRIPYTPTAQDGAAPMSMALLADRQGRIVSSSYPARYPPGGVIGGPGLGPLPEGIVADLHSNPKGYARQSTVAGAGVVWAVVPVYTAETRTVSIALRSAPGIGSGFTSMSSAPDARARSAGPSHTVTWPCPWSLRW